jgi:hypothetical protein
MKIPKKLNIIGSCRLMHFKTNPKSNRERSIDRWSDPLVVGVNSTHKTLYLFPRKTAGNAEKKHGLLYTPYDVPSAELKPIGQAIRLIYVPTLPELGYSELIHDWPNGAKLFANNITRPTCFAIQKRGKIFNQWGIM